MSRVPSARSNRYAKTAGPPRGGPAGSIPSADQARVTLPALMQEVHTFIRLVVPPPAGVRTVWMLGFQRRLVRRCEWDTLWPKPGPLPQTSHTLATGISWDWLSRVARGQAPGNLARLPDPTRRRPIALRTRNCRSRQLAWARVGECGRCRRPPVGRRRAGRPAAAPGGNRRAQRLP